MCMYLYSNRYIVISFHQVNLCQWKVKKGKNKAEKKIRVCFFKEGNFFFMLEARVSYICIHSRKRIAKRLVPLKSLTVWIKFRAKPSWPYFQTKQLNMLPFWRWKCFKWDYLCIESGLQLEVIYPFKWPMDLQDLEWLTFYCTFSVFLFMVSKDFNDQS